MSFTVQMSFFTSIFPAASLIFSTLASDRPLMLHRALRVVIWIPFTVQMPTTFIFLISATFCGQTGRGGVVRWPCGRTDLESNKMWLRFLTQQKNMFLWFKGCWKLWKYGLCHWTSCVTLTHNSMFLEDINVLEEGLLLKPRSISSFVRRQPKHVL